MFASFDTLVFIIISVHVIVPTSNSKIENIIFLLIGPVDIQVGDPGEVSDLTYPW